MKSFSDLPEYLQIYIRKLYPMGPKHPVNFYDEYANEKIPYLGNKSILETVKERGGEKKLIQMYNKMGSNWGAPYILKEPSDETK